MGSITEELEGGLADGPAPRFAAVLLAFALVLVPLAIRWARFVLASRDTEGGPRARATWGITDLALVFSFAFVAFLVVPFLPGSGILADLGKAMVLLAFVGAMCVQAARRSGVGGMRAMGLVPSGSARAAVFGLGAYVLLLPVVFGVFGLWPVLADALGLELEDQAVLEGILELRGADLWVAGVVAVVIGPFLEELLFRGFLQPTLARSLGTVPGVVLTSLGFAFLHGVSASGPIFVLALLLGWIQVRSGRLTATWAAHAAHNGAILAWMFASR